MSTPSTPTPPTPDPEEVDLHSTTEMPAFKLTPELSEPPETLIMPAFKLPKKPHLGNEEGDKK